MSKPKILEKPVTPPTGILGAHGEELIPEKVKRLKVPTIKDLDTMYRPINSQIMVIPLPDQTHASERILLPQTHQRLLNEGHIVAVGPKTPAEFEIGDCICWDAHTEWRFIDDKDGKFALCQPDNVMMIIKKADIDAANAKRK